MANNNKTTQTSGGIGFFGLLTIVFIALKLTGYIAWSWWWVLAPVGIPFAVFLLITTVVVMLVDR